ncbi:carbohydrate ABC transporter permease [Paenibacillus thalictri]|uniref:Sugar ABC transporter permease n=1 Tax=Paenibacillus thalictri TaxID=2527873 RepID=A0A4Q9DQQ0_9BACL|nr:sugar ABC transporter permease [Paenibacillus thalictri]TBL78957.1 sugar ABC transporter permease [Paenibacillus thalictri]
MSRSDAVQQSGVNGRVIVKSGGQLNRREKWYGYAFVMPMLIGYILFLFGPVVASFVMSFTNWNLTSALKFVGLANYRMAFFEDPVFVETIWNTLYFTLLFVPLNIVITLSLALLTQRSIPGIGFFRTAIFSPVVTSIVVWAIIWKYIFQTDNGLVNAILKWFGITGPAWLYNLELAIPVVVIVSLLKSLGMNMAIFLSALNGVPAMYYEAARIDGASRWRSFLHVTLPLISPSMFLVVMITLIGSMKVFGQIYILTKGGPGTSTHVMVYYIYEQAFKYNEFGYGSAISFVLFFIILLLTLFQWYGRKRWVHYEE